MREITFVLPSASGYKPFSRSNNGSNAEMDITPVYRKIGEHRLRQLRSIKVLRQMALRSRPMSYFNQQELRALERQITAIDAEIQWRKDQLRLF